MNRDIEDRMAESEDNRPLQQEAYFSDHWSENVYTEAEVRDRCELNPDEAAQYHLYRFPAISYQQFRETRAYSLLKDSDEAARENTAASP